MHTTNYTDTLILPSEDCRAQTSVEPEKLGTVAALQHALLDAAPYAMTSDDLLVQVTATRRGIDEDEHDALRGELFSKGQACLRASPLVKTYGWAVHHDSNSKVSLIAQGSPELKALADDPKITKKLGMRSSKAK